MEIVARRATLMLREAAEAFTRGKEDQIAPAPQRLEYDVVVVGGGPAGLAAASFCGRKFLRTAVFEGDCWGGILTRWCPDKKIDNYPGTRPGVRADELAQLLVDFARRSGVDLAEKRVEEISQDGEIRAGGVKYRGKVVILATGSTAAEAGIPREVEFADRDGGIFYKIPDPSRFRGKRVIILGGGDTALSHLQRLQGIASRITLVHRQKTLRSEYGAPEKPDEDGEVEIFPGTSVDAILGYDRIMGVRLKDLASGKTRDLPADAVVIAVGTKPNLALFRDLGVSLDSKGQVIADPWQRTSIPRFLAIGDVSSPLKMIVTAVAQAAVAAHQAYVEVRAPYWE
jgi:thioredoxin reductase (NADPH)